MRSGPRQSCLGAPPRARRRCWPPGGTSWLRASSSTRRCHACGRRLEEPATLAGDGWPRLCHCSTFSDPPFPCAQFLFSPALARSPYYRFPHCTLPRFSVKMSITLRDATEGDAKPGALEEGQPMDAWANASTICGFAPASAGCCGRGVFCQRRSSGRVGAPARRVACMAGGGSGWGCRGGRAVGACPVHMGHGV